MSVSTEIAAIRADPTKSGKDVYRLKCQSLYDALLPFVRGTYTYSGVQYTLWNLWLEDDGAILCLTVKAVTPASGNKAEVIHIRPQQVFRFVNPPVLTAAKNDDRLAAAREMIAGLL
jgi:hypothetical protein